MTNQKNQKIRIAILLLAFIFITLVMTSNALAIGITPGRVTLDFQPSLHKDIEFTIINNEHKEMKVLLYIEGELNGSIALHEKLIDFSSTEESKTFNYTIDLPAAIEKPGIHEARVVAMELPKETGAGTFVGATAAVATQLQIRVPYPYKYSEIRLDILPSEVNGTTRFFVEVNNLGQHGLVDMQATVEIFNSVNEKIAILKTNTQTIEAMQKKEISASWKADVNAGRYRAVATLVYDSSIATAEKIFSIGSLTLDIVDISVRNFRLGDIAKFDITVENKWSEQIDNVYADLQITENENIVADVKTPSVNILPLSRQVLNAYWDTAGIKEGSYEGKLLLNFADQVLERKLKTEITLNSIKVEILGVGITARATAAESGRQNLMFIIIIVLVVVNIAWFVYFKRREKKRG